MPETNEIIGLLLEKSILWLPKLVGVVFVIVIFVLLSRLAKNIIIKISKKLELDPNLANFFARTSKITLVIFGLVTALGTLGVDVSALVAGLGLTGFALGFALKDTISNLLSGILILLYKPFKVGDKVKISGHTGVVLSIDLRYTKLESDDSEILVPNSKLFTDPVIVYH